MSSNRTIFSRLILQQHQESDNLAVLGADSFPLSLPFMFSKAANTHDCTGRFRATQFKGQQKAEPEMGLVWRQFIWGCNLGDQGELRKVFNQAPATPGGVLNNTFQNQGVHTTWNFQCRKLGKSWDYQDEMATLRNHLRQSQKRGIYSLGTVLHWLICPVRQMPTPLNVCICGSQNISAGARRRGVRAAPRQKELQCI